MIKHRLNTVKHRLIVEKDRGNACRKNQEKKPAFFLANFFRDLSFYGTDCTTQSKKVMVCLWSSIYDWLSCSSWLPPPGLWQQSSWLRPVDAWMKRPSSLRPQWHFDPIGTSTVTFCPCDHMNLVHLCSLVLCWTFCLSPMPTFMDQMLRCDIGPFFSFGQPLQYPPKKTRIFLS